MNNLNSILVEGALIDNPNYRLTPKGTPLCTFTIETNRFFKQGDDKKLGKEVSYFDIEAWGKIAEWCKRQGYKDRGVRVVGRLKQNRWKSADGKDHSSVVVIAEQLDFRPDFRKDAPVVEEPESVEA